jgi:5-methylcytosine-specific restriction endonuclease McrA
MCGATDSLCIDHHRPLSAGNALVLSNAVLLCKGCNSEKHNKEPEAFYGVEECLDLDIRLLLIEYLYGQSTSDRCSTKEK